MWCVEKNARLNWKPIVVVNITSWKRNFESDEKEAKLLNNNEIIKSLYN